MNSSEFTSNIWNINHCLIVLVTPEAQEIHSWVRNRKWTRSVDRNLGMFREYPLPPSSR